MQGKRTVNSIIKNITGGQNSAHAYIIEGRAGSAREGFISQLAMGLECLDPDVSARPCGRCESCRQVAAGSSMDIVRMQMSGKTGYKSEDAGAFAGRLDMGAYGRFLVGIIDDADSLSETVQNKLLKTLEEPRENVILLLGASNPDHLLSTVRSRCSIIRPAEDMQADEKSKGIRALSEIYVSGGEGFYAARDSIEKNIKSGDDARSLIEAVEDLLREKMRTSGDPQAWAVMIENCERASADMETGMDRTRALKRLWLELNAAVKRT